MKTNAPLRPQKPRLQAMMDSTMTAPNHGNDSRHNDGHSNDVRHERKLRKLRS